MEGVDGGGGEEGGDQGGESGDGGDRFGKHVSGVDISGDVVEDGLGEVNGVRKGLEVNIEGRRDEELGCEGGGGVDEGLVLGNGGVAAEEVNHVGGVRVKRSGEGDIQGLEGGLEPFDQFHSVGSGDQFALGAGGNNALLAV